MTAEARVLTRPSPGSRLLGLGTIYGKTLRDSLRAALVVGGIASLFMLGTGVPYGVSPEFSTLELRRAFIAGLTVLPPALRGLLGEPINLDYMGGFLSWRVGNFLPVVLGLWPVIALSGTLAGEAAKGSLDLLASTPQSRRTIAIEKLAGHVTAVVLAMLLLAATIWAVGAFFGRLPGDEIAVPAALGQVTLYGVMMLFVGGVAFATAPFVGRTRAAAFGLLVLFGSYLVESYASLSDILDRLSRLSFFDWTAGHRPMAGITDWTSVAILAVLTVVLLAVGTVAFGRRDIGAIADVGWLRLPSLPVGIRGPFGRQLSDRAGLAIAWGLGVGVYALLVIASADAFSKLIDSLPQIEALLRSIYPDLDLHEPSGLLQLTFFSFGSFVLGLAGASFLAGWATDEGRRRLEVVLSTPRSRASWAFLSAMGVLAAIALMCAVVAAFIVAGVASQGGDVWPPVVGIAVLALAAAAFAGVGLAAGGLIRTSLAVGVTGFLVIATLLLDTLGAALKLPEWVLDLSLYRHLGQPMAGVVEPFGVAVAALMAIGGLILCTLGLRRRDIGR
jgi:ABC-2 type transport system permease protein